MKKSFREHHLFQILSLFERQPLPLDVFLRNYFRQHKAVGSKDRKEICENLYAMIRWRALLDYFCEKPIDWEKRFKAFQTISYEDTLHNNCIPEYVRVSFPKSFYQLLSDSLGPKQAFAFCVASNDIAPTTVRVNLLKTTRDNLLTRWKEHYDVQPCKYSNIGIQFKEKVNFFGMEEFKAGLFEVQDEGSQLIADLVNVEPGQWLLDYCAGAGGKTLAIAPKMQEKGQIFLHDIRESALMEAKKRLNRAGIQNAQRLSANSPNKMTHKLRMDWVLVDAPCSGTGTLRRNPDMKWKFDTQSLHRLVEEQRQIFKEALDFLKPDGHIVYATCSVLPQENEHQADYFCKNFGVEQIGTAFSSTPKPGQMDGFFAVVFKKKKD